MSRPFHAPVEVPILEPERLKLRGHGLDDFIHAAAIGPHPEATRYIGGKPLSEEESWARLLRYVGHWSLLGFGYWVVEEKKTGNFIGEVGFADYKRDLPALKGLPEVGWVFSSQVRGKGYATEAVRAAVAWGDTRFPSARTACIINPDKPAPMPGQEKCAYPESHLTTYNSRPTVMFVRAPRPPNPNPRP